ncbi:MAG: GDYXXLXY domain-containing protein [Thermoguttaceae bacterium]
MTNFHKTLAIIGVIVLQFGLLASMTWSRAIVLKTGTPITVRTTGIDPRDLFRGDYVVLRYEFSRYDNISGQISDSNLRRRNYQFFADNNGRFVYVTFIPSDNKTAKANGEHLWRAESVSLEKPKDGVFLAGRLRMYGEIDFGIEAYYVQQGTGLELERNLRNGSGFAGLVDIVVGPNGEAMIKTVRTRPIAEIDSQSPPGME